MTRPSAEWLLPAKIIVMLQWGTEKKTLFFFSFLFRAAPVAQGSSQAKGQIRAASMTYTTAHGNARSFKPLNEARDWTHSLIDTSRIRFCWAVTGTPDQSFFVMNAVAMDQSMCQLSCRWCLSLLFYSGKHTAVSRSGNKITRNWNLFSFVNHL